MVNNIEKEFIHCKKCGKRLIARLPDGSGEFIFGKQIEDKHGRPIAGGKSPVNLKIWGLLQMECLSWTCNHTTTISFFPQGVEQKTIVNTKSPVTDNL